MPSGICAKTAPLAITARAAATCLSTPTPPRQTGSRPPIRWISRSRQRGPKADGPDPRNHTRGSSGRAWSTTNGSIQPRWAAADHEVAAAARDELAPLDVDVEAEHAEQHDPGDDRQEPDEEPGPGLGSPAEPVETLGRTAACSGQRLGRDPARRRPVATPSAVAPDAPPGASVTWSRSPGRPGRRRSPSAVESGRPIGVVAVACTSAVARSAAARSSASISPTLGPGRRWRATSTVTAMTIVMPDTICAVGMPASVQL